jgi:hypothetical protein
MRRLGLSFWLGVLACAAGCRSSGTSSAPPATAGGTPASAAPADGATPSGASAPPAITVVSGGAPPKQPLKLTFRPGQTERATWDLSSRLALAVGQMRPPELRPPTIRLSVRSEVSEVDDAGAAIVETTIDAVEVVASPDTPPQLASTLSTELQALKDVRVAAEVSPLARVERVGFRRADAASPQVKTALEAIRQSLQLLPTLPREAVGRGASWRVDSHPRTPLLALDQVVDYHLPEAAVVDRIVRIAGSLRQSAAPQPVALPNLPPGAKVTLRSYSGSGDVRAERAEGEIYGALEARLTTRLTATVEGRNEPERELRMATSYDLRLTPKR